MRIYRANMEKIDLLLMGGRRWFHKTAGTRFYFSGEALRKILDVKSSSIEGIEHDMEYIKSFVKTLDEMRLYYDQDSMEFRAYDSVNTFLFIDVCKRLESWAYTNKLAPIAKFVARLKNALATKDMAIMGPDTGPLNQYLVCSRYYFLLLLQKTVEHERIIPLELAESMSKCSDYVMVSMHKKGAEAIAAQYKTLEELVENNINLFKFKQYM
jgi:hypothetical protein